MATKVFEVPFYKGTFTDTVNGTTPTIGGSVPISRGEKGMQIFSNNPSNYLDYAKILTAGTYSAILWIKPKQLGLVTHSLFDLRTASGTECAFIYGASYGKAATGTFYVNGIASTTALFNEYQCVILNGFTNVSTVINLLVSNSHGNTLYGYMGYFAIHSGTLTESERAKAYSDFLNSYPMLPEKYPQQSLMNKPMDLSRLKDTGLVAAYNMIPNGNTLVDISGNGYNLTTKNLISLKSGLNFPSGSANMVGASSTSFYNPGSNPFSINCRLRADTTKANYNICRKTASYTNGFTISLGSIISKYAFTVYLNNVPFLTTGYHVVPYIMNTITININTVVGGTTNVDFYVNGIFVERVSSAGVTAMSNSEKFAIGDYAHGGWSAFKGEMQDFRIYNRALSLQEIKNYHNSFVKPYLVEDFSSEGADGVAKVPTGWVKQSGSFKVGEWVPAVSNLVDYSNLLTTGGFSKTSNNTFSYTTSATTSYIVRLSFLTIGRRYLTKFRCISNPNNTQLILGGGGTSYYKSTLTLVPKEGVTYSYDGNGGAQTTDFRLRVSIGQPSGLIVDNIEIIELPPLPTFKPGTKYLECVTAGTLALPSKQAYGTWEWDLYKGGNENDIKILFIKAGNASYVFRIYTGEDIYLRRNGSVGGFQTINSYVAINAWYRFKITRTISGVFAVYIKGGSFGTTAWTLLLTQSGTNPITDNVNITSEYFVLDLDAGDRIANIKLTEGIEV